MLLNVHDPKVRRRAGKLDTALAFDLLRCIWNLAEPDVERILKLSLRLDPPLRRRLMHAAAVYVTTVHRGYNWSRLREIEARTIPAKEDRVMETLMESEKQLIEKGVGIGRQESRQEVAEQMLRDGFDDRIVVKYSKLSAESVADLKRKVNGG